MSKKPELTVVVPAYHEEAGLGLFVERLGNVLAACCETFEICIIDDGSRDGTWSEITRICQLRQFVRAQRFSRNFGKEAAILAGLRASYGRCVVVMDADGQHPVELLPEMLAIWRSGKAKIVAGRKADRSNDSLLAKFNAKLFNSLMRALTGLDLAGASDYRLLDREVVDTLLRFPEKVRFFRGMTIWTGFTTVHVDFNVAPRIAGQTQWSTAQLTNLAITAITAYSAKPLGLVFRLGFFGMLAAAVLMLQALYSWTTGIAISGWTSLTVVILFFSSANLLGIGIMGAYLAQIFNEIKARPEFLISERLGDTLESPTDAPQDA